MQSQLLNPQVVSHSSSLAGVLRVIASAEIEGRSDSIGCGYFEAPEAAASAPSRAEQAPPQVGFDVLFRYFCMV